MSDLKKTHYDYVYDYVKPAICNLLKDSKDKCIYPISGFARFRFHTEACMLIFFFWRLYKNYALQFPFNS